MIMERDGEIIVKPLLSKPVEDAMGIFEGGQSALEALLADRAQEAKQ
jgi:hypothetical protein